MPEGKQKTKRNETDMMKKMLANSKPLSLFKEGFRNQTSVVCLFPMASPLHVPGRDGPFRPWTNRNPGTDQYESVGFRYTVTFVEQYRSYVTRFPGMELCRSFPCLTWTWCTDQWHERSPLHFFHRAINMLISHSLRDRGGLQHSAFKVSNIEICHYA